MAVSPQLLALAAVTPVRRGNVTSWSISMDFRYPFPWRTVSAFVLRQKTKGPPDDNVTLAVERNIFRYTVKMPWYARLMLGKSIVWDDVLAMDESKQILSEIGENVSLHKRGSVRDTSCWRACVDDENVTVYNKRVDFNIRMPIGPKIMMQVAQPLIRWFETKSQLCRELEVVAIRDFIDQEASKASGDSSNQDYFETGTNEERAVIAAVAAANVANLDKVLDSRTKGSDDGQ